MEQVKQTDECKCIGSKELKSIKKQLADLNSEIAELRTELATLRKAVRK